CICICICIWAVHCQFKICFVNGFRPFCERFVFVLLFFVEFASARSAVIMLVGIVNLFGIVPMAAEAAQALVN
ncbi:MAG: hypothetical protein EBT12_13080, partial [Marivivens sp.]|nr:hypothetical protein [Marivivens sp.]